MDGRWDVRTGLCSTARMLPRGVLYMWNWGLGAPVFRGSSERGEIIDVMEFL